MLKGLGGDANQCLELSLQCIPQNKTDWWTDRGKGDSCSDKANVGNVSAKSHG